MTTKASTNGVAKKAEAAKTATPKKEEKSPVVKMADETLKKMVEFQQTVERINELQGLVDDYSKVSDTLKGLTEFKNIQNESVQFSISDLTSDAQFTTYNSTLIAMVIGTLTEKLKAKQQELIDRILNFEM